MSKTLNTTPRLDGFRFPGEFEPHEACWLMWPERADIYPFGAKLVQKTYIELINKISMYENVSLCVSPEHYQAVRKIFSSKVRVVEVSSNGNWLRDTGPTFLTNNEGMIRGIDWEFNAWGGLNGGCYFPWDKDNQVAQRILEIENIDRYKCNIFLEGGAIISDGEGTLLTTKETLLNPNRNPNLDIKEIEIILRNYLNVEKIIWIERGLFLDEAGGHIDGICCFIKPGVVALNWTDDKLDPQYEISCEAFEILSSQIDAKGRKLNIHKIHQPTPQFITKEESKLIKKVEGTVSRNANERLPATYINFYFANNAVILPLFNDSKYDSLAISKFKSIFPKRKIVTIQSREILLGGGNIHCMTQQQPKTIIQNII